MVRPQATSFLEPLLLDHGRGVQVREVVLTPNSELLGQTLAQANLRSRVGDILVLAYRRRGTQDFLPAAPQVTLDDGTTLIVMGDKGSAQKLLELM